MNLSKLKFWKYDKIRYSLLVAALFLMGMAVLIYLPNLLKVTERQLLVSSNGFGENIARVLAAESKKTTIKVVSHNLTAPQFSSHSVIAYDLTTQTILYQKNIHQHLAPASTTKIMTALIGADFYQPADVLTVSSVDLVGGSSMGLQVGETLSFRSLLYGMLLNSGNDAAFTIASNYPGGVEGFVTAMNQKVQDLHLQDTHFTNPAGFDGDSHYTSAFDLSQIAKEVVNHPQLARVVATKDTYVTDWGDSATNSAKPRHILHNLNQLLNEDGVLGIKTGTTEKAGESFVGLVERNNHRVLTVVLNSDDRFGETKQLMDWVYQNYSWTEVTE